MQKNKLKNSIKTFLFIAMFFTLPSFAKAGTTNITTCQDLNVANETYVLQNDISSNGTCLSVSASNVTLDLGGHTVTYDNAAPLAVTNGSFETALSGSWDVTGAANATRAEGAYLTPAVYAGTYAINIATPTADQTIQSVGTVTLQPNTTYSLSGMVFNQVSDDISMSVEFNGTSVKAVQSGRTWRGFQYINATYTTGSTAEAYKIDLKVSGATSAAAGTVFFDDIRVQQTASYGVKAGDETPTWARMVVIKNGTITQGQAHGDFSHAVNIKGTIPADNPSYEVANLTITVSGNSSKAVEANSITNASIHDLIIYSNVDTIKSRDHYDGALIHIVYGGHSGSIYNNTIHSGIQTGIFTRGSDTADNLIAIYNNNITLQSKYTNDFAISAYGEHGADIYSNTIDCASGNNACRGIYIGGANNGGIIHGNTVAVHYRLNNQEYSGCGGAAYGIQIEEGMNTEVYGNDVTANADECASAAFRYFGPDDAAPQYNNVHDNTFRALAVSGSASLASVVRIIESYAQHLTFSDNVMITNSNFLYIDGTNTENEARSLTLERNTYQLNYPKALKYYPLVDSAYVNGSYYVPRNVTLSDNTYADATVRGDMSTAQFVSVYRSYGVDPYAYNVVITEASGADTTAPGAPAGLSVN